MKLAKTSTSNSLVAVLTAFSLLLAMIGGVRHASAQSTFVGDYDTNFAAPLGYYIDPQNPVPPANDTNDTHFYTGELLPDGSIIAGGRHVDQAPRGDFYMRKFTSSGAVDASFGTNGFVRTNFHTRSDGVAGNDIPQNLRVQPDGKIVFAGQCTVFGSVVEFGQDACIVRYNANGTLDTSFGGFPVPVSNGPNETHQVPIDPGKVIFQTGIRANGQLRGTGGIYYDMAIQPDGKIVLIGETRDEIAPFGQFGEPSFRRGAIIVRLNPNGSLDTTFGSNGIARWSAPEAFPGCSTYPANYQPRNFLAVRLQPDGRIIAVGYNSTHDCGGSSASGNRFVVTRWTAAGQLETVRHFDNNAAFDFQDERATSVHLTRDASKILVSGSYRNVSGTPAGRQKPTMVRLNIADLSLDTSFGTGGIVQYNRVFDNSSHSTLYVKAIQPDGRIIGTDTDANGSVVRFNPDGSSDQSFGNRSIDDSNALPRGRLRVTITHQGFIIPIDTGQILVRPNGRMNLIGRVGDFTFGIGRAVVSQNTSTGAQNPVDDAQTFAFVHYYDFLNREADSSGLAFWTGNITGCGSNAGCVQAMRVNVSAAFFLSIEFQETGYLAYRLYKAAHGDLPGKPVPLRREEFLPDTQTLGEGVVVNQGDWQQRLEQNKQNFVATFVLRPRFAAAYPSNMTATEFVDKLNQNAGGVLDGAERAQLIAELGQTPGDAQKRASVLRSVAEDQTLRDAELRKAFVLMQYFGYLRRDPDAAPDADFSGYNFWLGKLNEFGGDYIGAEMVRAFIESAEYRKRFGQ